MVYIRTSVRVIADHIAIMTGSNFLVKAWTAVSNWDSSELE